jgi:hypothetical protein
MVKLNETALVALLESDTGPVARDIRRRAENIGAIAAQNASGDMVNIRSHALLGGLTVGEVEVGPTGPQVVVGTDAMSTWHGQPFSYPAYLDQTYRPWLSSALRDGFDI